MIFGSYTAFFSLNNSIIPVTGAWLGFGGVSYFGIAKIILMMIFFGRLFSLHYLAFHLPGIAAAYYWASDSPMIRAVLPFVCMFLFIVHPIGANAWLYAMYWWIPIVLYFSSRNHLFLQALGSTFVAHAVGSVIWLYTVPMTAETWMALIPIVCIERLLFATGMVIFYTLCQKISLPAVRKLFVLPKKIA